MMALLIAIVFVACGGKSDDLTAEEKIAGKDEKTWKAKRETDATGDVDRLNKDEKRESITLEDTRDGLHWIYIVALTKVGAYAGLPPYLRVIVLMDGNVIEPNVSEDS